MTDRPSSQFSRRDALAFGVSGAALLLGAAGARAQQPAKPPTFGFENVLARARELSGQPYDTGVHEVPEELKKLSFDRYRNIQFRADKSLLAAGGGPFRMQMYHLGFLYQKPVVINIVRDGIATPVPYSGSLFDYAGAKFERPLPVDLGFAGFRLNYPLNDPRVMDELISFFGSSYFRVLGRHEVYGLSARGATIGTGGPKGTEEFPFFREFWMEMPGQNAERAVIYALLDSESLTGAFRFDIYPGDDTVVDVQATIIPRKPIPKLGLAPLTSMYFYGENSRRTLKDYRPELHDSDGLLMHTGAGEWVWRPLANPLVDEITVFADKDPKGFGLMQRDRNFEHYQDLDLGYELRPSYWIEPHAGWGDGRLELFIFPTDDETNDNTVLYWVPKAPVEPGKEIAIGYKLTVLPDDRSLNKGGRVINTYSAPAAALGATDGPADGAQRFLVDFAGGELDYYLKDPARIQVIATLSQGRVLRTFVAPNRNVKGFRIGVDVQLDKGQASDIRMFLKADNRTLTETWAFQIHRAADPAPQAPAPAPQTPAPQTPAPAPQVPAPQPPKP